MIRDYFNALRFKPWAKIERFDPRWRDRIQQMAQFVLETDASVVDVGCGPMWLKECLREGVRYTGIDYKIRGPGTVVCDLNKSELPPLYADVYFVSGCMEYLHDPRKHIDRISTYTDSRCIISYCCTDQFPDRRFRNERGWVNHLSAEEIESLFSEAGMPLIHKSLGPNKNSIFVFSSRAPDAFDDLPMK